MDLPGPNLGYALQAIMTPLVTSGLDTDENMAILFGGKDRVARLHQETRMMVLAFPPEGSPAYEMVSRG